uniref:Cysteine-rich and transmembrane domain-containing protein 1 n=1 Tax=Neogobius melanostomus TaxID=47308 RepID=A0A8C6WNI3_9GOBI
MCLRLVPLHLCLALSTLRRPRRTLFPSPVFNFASLSAPHTFFSSCLSLSLSLAVYVVEDRRRDDSDTCLTACWTALCCCCLWDMLT